MNIVTSLQSHWQILVNAMVNSLAKTVTVVNTVRNSELRPQGRFCDASETGPRPSCKHQSKNSVVDMVRHLQRRHPRRLSDRRALNPQRLVQSEEDTVVNIARPLRCHQQSLSGRRALKLQTLSSISTLYATQGQILSESPTDAASGRWHLNRR